MTLMVPSSLMKELRPRRSVVGSAEAGPTAATVKRLLPKIAKELSKDRRFHGKKTYADVFEAGLATEEAPELRPLREAALALLRSPTEAALASADIDALACAEIMLRRISSEVSFLPALLQVRGTEDTLRVVVRGTFFEVTAGTGGWTTAIWIKSVATDEWNVGGWMDRLLPLRHAICAATDDEYRKLVETARELRGTFDLDRRAYVAWLFPDEPWANEDLKEAQERPIGPGASASSYGFLLAAATDIDLIREEVSRTPGCLPGHALDLVHALPPEQAIPLFAERLPALLQKPKWSALAKTPPRQLAQAIACFRTKEAAAALAPYAANPILAPIVLGFFRDAPELASDAPIGKGAEAVERVVEMAIELEVDPSIAPTPKLLLDRPWRAKKGKKKDEEHLAVERIVEGERFDPPPPMPPFVPHYRVREMTNEEHSRWRAEVSSPDPMTYVDFVYSRTGGATPNSWVYEYLRVPPDDQIWAWNTSSAWLASTPLHFVKEHGLAAIPGFFQRDWVKWLGGYGGDVYLQAAMRLVSPRIAPLIARVAQRKKKHRRVALAWLEDNATVAALGLIPDAVGPKGEARSDAEAALLFLARGGHDVASIADRYGAGARSMIDALLARDPLSLGVGPPKPPPFLRGSELTPIALASGGVLGPEGRGALLEMLQVAPTDQPYAGIAELEKLCTRSSLERLARELVEQWLLGDAPGRHEWMLFSAALFPSEQTTRRIGALARTWAFKDQAKAGRACVALAKIGSDLALLHLAQVADKTRFDALRKETRALLEQAAEARDLTLDELADRTVPDAGLSADGTMTLPIGEKTLTVRLDETLRPVLFDEQNTRLKMLPRGAKEAKERYDALKKDLDAVADRELRRFERAMTSGRTWSADDFETRIVGHPLLIHLARRLVWVAVKGATTTLFRVAEDRSFADENDDVFDLPDDAHVRLAHPAREGKALVPWSRTFTDYAIVQPFEQLGRAIHSIEDSEREALELKRLGGITVPAKKVMGFLEARGFRRDNAGFISAFLRDVAAAEGDTIVVRVPLSSAIEIAYLDNTPDASTVAPSLSTATGERVPFGALDVVAFSELVRDLEALRAVTL